MFELKDVIGWIITIVIALLGTKLVIHIKGTSTKKNNTINQNVNGNNNTLVGGDITVDKDN